MNFDVHRQQKRNFSLAGIFLAFENVTASVYQLNLARVVLTLSPSKIGHAHIEEKKYIYLRIYVSLRSLILCGLISFNNTRTQKAEQLFSRLD